MTENRHNVPDQPSPENMSADPALEAAREQGHEGTDCMCGQLSSRLSRCSCSRWSHWASSV
ncbi:MAG: hypothetical protein R3B91_07780 [Planctomycetaceae bacterium]